MSYFDFIQAKMINEKFNNLFGGDLENLNQKSDKKDMDITDLFKKLLKKLS